MMSSNRRNEIIEILKLSKNPISATTLSNRFKVSRQAIVGDIALLRAEGKEIIATSRGYIYNKEKNENIFLLACKHGEEQVEDELYTIVDYGGKLLDVTVEHPLYGELCAQLYLSNRYEIEIFLNKRKEYKASLLSELTEGIHVHKIQCDKREQFEEIKRQLLKKGILLVVD